MDTYTILGIIVLFAFYGSYFAKVFSQSKQGIKTNRMGKGDKPRRTYFIEIILKVITLLIAGIQLISVLFNGKLSLIIQNSVIRHTGFAISLLGVTVFIISMITMSDSWRAGVDKTQKTKMIKEGIYKYSRNPAFVGFDLFYIGLALAFSNVFNIIFTCASILMFHFQIIEEEKFLSISFGKEYLDYKNTTGRYLDLGRKKMVSKKNYN